MAYLLDTTPITDSARLPIKKGTLAFLQTSHKNDIFNLIRGLIGSTYNGLNVYVLYGCVNSGSGSVYNISDGAVFYFGEVFQVQSTTFTAASGQTAVCSILTTQDTTNADPVTFTDAVARNVHNIRTVQITSAVAGSGIKDFANVIFYDFTTAKKIATDAIKGYMRFATQNEVNAGSNTDSAVTPNTLLVTPSVVGYTGNTKMFVKILTITNWSMDSTNDITIIHGIADFTKIRGVECMIIENDGSGVWPLDGMNAGNAIAGGVGQIASGAITLKMVDGGFFNDGSRFGGATNPRGWVKVTYTE
jgi:hypothetical protein